MQTASIASATTTTTTTTTTILSHPRLPLPLPRRPATVSFLPRRISCEVAVTSLEVSSSAVSTSSSSSYTSEELEALGKVGARVKVKVPLTVYHVPKVPELDLEGMEGVVKQYVGIWKENRISANIPFKVEFVVEGGVEERPGTFKFFAHLRDDEVEFLGVD